MLDSDAYGPGNGDLLDPEPNERDIVKSARAKIRLGQSIMQQQHTRMERDLQMLSGKQWDDEVYNIRISESRPVSTNNIIRPYVNRVKNPLLLNPIRPLVKLKDRDKERMCNGLIGAIMQASGGNSACVEAAETAIACGIGYIIVDVIPEPGNRKREPVIRYRTCERPTNIFLDPMSREKDGSDAMWAVEINFVNLEQVERKYKMKFSSASYSEDYGANFPTPDGSICSLIMWEMVTDKDDWDWCQITHIIGDKVISCVKYPTTSLMVIPVYGERLYDQNEYWGGIVKALEDAQRNHNWYQSLSIEYMAMAPKSPWLVAEGQVSKDQMPYWAKQNVKNYAYLTWRPTMLENGQMAPPPQRMATSVDVGGITAELQRNLGDMSRYSGVPDAMMSGANEGGESGEAINSRLGSAEISTAHYYDNYSLSLSRMGRVTIELAPAVYNRDRRVVFLGDDNHIYSKIVNINEKIDQADLLEMDIDMSGGPSNEMRRKESISAMQTLFQLDPTSIPKILPHYIKMLDLPDGDHLIRDLNGETDPDSEIDPRVNTILQTANQTIGVQQQHIQMMQQEIQQLKNRDQLDIQKEQIRIQGQKELEKMKIEAREKELILESKAKEDREKLMAQIRTMEEKLKTQEEIKRTIIEHKLDMDRDREIQDGDLKMEGNRMAFDMASKVLDHAHEKEATIIDHHLEIAKHKEIPPKTPTAKE